jgi:hypothetical protein
LKAKMSGMQQHYKELGEHDSLRAEIVEMTHKVTVIRALII